MIETGKFYMGAAIEFKAYLCQDLLTDPRRSLPAGISDARDLISRLVVFPFHQDSYGHL